MEKTIRQIPIEKLEQFENSRSTYDPLEMSELMQSMKYCGLLQPIGVREKKNGKFEIMFGNRRFVAAKKLDWKTIPAIEQDTETNELILNLTENIQRSNPPVIEQARIVHLLINQGMRIEEISTRLGVSLNKAKRLLDIYRNVPIEFRGSIARHGEKQASKKGLISQDVVTKNLAIKRTYELDKKQTLNLFNWTKENPNTSKDLVETVSAVMATGKTLKQAIHTAEQSVVIRAAFVFNKKAVDRFPNRREFIKAMERALAEEPVLGFIGHRKESEAPPKIKVVVKKK